MACFFCFGDNSDMPKSTHALTLGGDPDRVEAAFYEAMRNGDLEQLMACWADEDEVVCLHPGSGERLLGLGAIRASFEAIFAQGAIPLSVREVRKITSLTSAVHSVIEEVQVETEQGPKLAFAYATNVYQRTPQGWRLVAHHASPGVPDALPDVDPLASLAAPTQVH